MTKNNCPICNRELIIEYVERYILLENDRFEFINEYVEVKCSYYIHHDIGKKKRKEILNNFKKELNTQRQIPMELEE